MIARGVAAALLLVLMVGTPSRAADQTAAAREAFSEGSRLFDVGEYGKALDSFKRAYLLDAKPGLLFNIASCHRKLGHRDEAIEFYERYLDKVPDGPDRDEIEKLVATLKSSPPPAAVTDAPPVAASAPPVVASSPLIVVSPTPAPEASPPPARSSGRWWLWLVGGGAVIVAAAILVAVVAAPRDAMAAPTTLGPIDLVFH